MCGLDTDDQALMTQRHLRRRRDFHVFEIALESPAAHSVANDIEECQHARLGAIDDVVLEIFEITPSRAAGIRHGRHVHAEGEAVGVETEVPGIRAALPGTGEHVRVNID